MKASGNGHQQLRISLPLYLMLTSPTIMALYDNQRMGEDSQRIVDRQEDMKRNEKSKKKEKGKEDQIVSIVIDHWEMDEDFVIEENERTADWCDSNEKIIAMSRRMRNTNPSWHFGDVRNLIIDIDKVLGCKDKGHTRWPRADLLSDREVKTYEDFMEFDKF